MNVVMDDQKTLIRIKQNGFVSTPKQLALSPVAPEPRRRCSSFPTLVGTHKLSFGQDVTIHRAQQFLLGRAGFQYQIDVECIKLEVITVRFSWWRTRPAVTDAFEIVDPLFGAKGQ